MEDHEVATAVSSLEFVGSSALTETSPAPEDLIQDTNVDLSSQISQHPASGLPAPTPDRSLTRPKGSRTKPVSIMHGNWRNGLEIGILTGIILMVWVLFSIPTILYALPPNIREV